MTIAIRSSTFAALLLVFAASASAQDPPGGRWPFGPSDPSTPPTCADWQGSNVQVVEVLVRAGADLEQTDGSGQTALHAAARWSPVAFPLLLRLGADPNVRDADGKTPLDYAFANRLLQGLPEVRRMREAMWRR